MREHIKCPECDSLDAEVVHTEWFADGVERIRICNECPTQWTVGYGNPIVTKVKNLHEEEDE